MNFTLRASASSIDAVSVVVGEPHQPGGRLGGGLQHKDPRQNGELGKVVRQILLGQRHGFDRRHLDPRLERANSIEQAKSHDEGLATVRERPRAGEVREIWANTPHDGKIAKQVIVAVPRRPHNA